MMSWAQSAHSLHGRRSNAEIAEQLGISLSSVERKLRVIRGQLERTLEQREADDHNTGD